eukprot:CAMPEP_0181247090 /NCGR_PEP_ID=MMETSP1096-20121128/44402_1 /TAXON_ID=156174 ORGANISM="Chrysochromulina ericina, Strain CCMP281" /NCGR_SAMPLE_ID=MMETSP1096 /ASSEMBLY_ACC=CAM_ASM_000453 /LENGTH=124 /DNA_ID=CAMNT_0023344071 /DNA_START=237 /DNA_END=611 /DNA_ORIENTATION=-
MSLGVCDGAAEFSWALMLHSGKLNDTCRPMGRRTPPEGFPKLAGSEHVIIDPSGEMKDLDGRAVGAVIEVIVDADEGSLSFRINYGPALPALQGFPRGALLRPYARLFYREGDRVTVTPGCLTS